MKMTKKGASEITLMNAVTMVLAGFVLLMIFASCTNVFKQKDKVEDEASKQLLKDMTDKINELDYEGEFLIAVGTLSSDHRLISFDAGKALSGNTKRPTVGSTGCGSISNACICICKDKDCKTSLDCNAFSSDNIVDITYNGADYIDLTGDIDVAVKMSVDRKTSPDKPTLKVDDLPKFVDKIKQ